MKFSNTNPIVVKKKKSFWQIFKKNLPLTIMDHYPEYDSL